MNVTKQELLSALLDDEAGEFERRRLLDELEHDDELLSTWQRYALVGEVVRDAKTPIIKRNFLAGIHAAIDDEIETPMVATPVDPVAVKAEAKSATVVPMWRNIMQYGMAAGLGAVVMASGLMLTNTASTQVASNQSVPTTEALALTSTNINALPVASTAKTSRPISRLDPKTQALLKSYIKDHIRYASTTSVVPTVRAVSYNQ